MQKLFDISGKKLIDKSYDNNPIQMLTSDLKNGFYFYEVTLETGSKFRGKIIK